MVRENAAIASNSAPLSEKELADIKTMLEENKKMAELYCTGCEYCLLPPGCEDTQGF